MARTDVQAPQRRPDDAEVGARLSAFARELRRRRDLLRLSQGGLAEISGVARTVICQIESGRRVPTVRTYARLCAALGLDGAPATALPPRTPARLDADLVAALCAGLLATRDVALCDLASAAGISVPALRENLEGIAERLRPAGVTVTDDGARLRVWPLGGAPADVVATLTDDVETLADPSREQMEVLAIVAYFRHPDREQVERARGEDSATLLERLVHAGLLAKVRESTGYHRNLYRVTGKALRVAGFQTAEAMRRAVIAAVSAADLARLHDAAGLPAEDGDVEREAAG